MDELELKRAMARRVSIAEGVTPVDAHGNEVMSPRDAMGCLGPYWDARHPDHERVKAAVAEHFGQAFPEPPDAGPPAIAQEAASLFNDAATAGKP